MSTMDWDDGLVVEKIPTADSVRQKIQSLIDAVNETTNRGDTTLTDAIYHLKDGYNQTDPEEPVEKLITFTVDDITYTATDGMTWREFMDSEFNADGAFMNDDPGTVQHRKMGFSSVNHVGGLYSQIIDSVIEDGGQYYSAGYIHISFYDRDDNYNGSTDIECYYGTTLGNLFYNMEYENDGKTYTINGKSTEKIFLGDYYTANQK